MVEMLSQDEINALLNESGGDDKLSPESISAIIEAYDVYMGSAANTLFTLLGKKTTITEPTQETLKDSEFVEKYAEKSVYILVEYKDGLSGKTFFILKEQDVKIITDLMMGGEGTELPEELTDMHLSAISEAMNQMIGSASTALSELISSKVDINPPNAEFVDIEELDKAEFDIENNSLLVMTYKFNIEGLIDSEIVAVMNFNIANELANLLKPEEVEEVVEPEPEVPVAPQAPSQSQPTPSQPSEQRNVNAQRVEFESFDDELSGVGSNKIELIRDVPLEITVELGRTKKMIQDILSFAPGSVVELNKLVGESLDILANGKKIATGEVVVVDDNYGVKITDILVPDKRLSNI